MTTTELFKASTQYGDFTGSSSVDVADKDDPSDYLRERGYMKGGEFLVGLEAYVGESHGRTPDSVHVRFMIATQGDHDSVKAAIDSSNGPVSVRKFSKDMSPAVFFSLFKRFSVAFSSHGMLEGREITYSDD